MCIRDSYHITMADKDYKVQVGVEAKADTRGLAPVNKGLDKVRKTASCV